MTNTRDYFYKYYDVEGAILTLKNCTRKWSNSSEFNDPFDCQFDFELTGSNKEITIANKNMTVKYLTGEIPVPKHLELLETKFGKVGNIIEEFKRDPEEKQKILIQRLIKEENIYSEDFIREKKEKAATLLKIPHLSIFCLTETKDNLLMWAHYSENHKGIVIKFKNVPEVDSPLICAEKVFYQNNIPCFSVLDIINKKVKGEEVRKSFTLTKSKHWEYEKEWRIVSELRDKSKPCEILPFAPEEIEDVYLGCRMKDENRETIIKIIKDKYPWVGIHQAKESKEKFELIFEQI